MILQPALIEDAMPQDAARLPRIADRLNKVEHGSLKADAAIHRVLGLAGPLLAYTTDACHADVLLAIASDDR